MTPEAFEAALDKSLAQHLSTKAPPNLAESIRYSLLAPGKRIRPRLALACSRMLGLRDEAALPAALAIEMLHCFTLIHDDLPCMDNDDFRRGRPSNHKVHGEDLALLAGDALLTLSVEVLAEAGPHVSQDAFFRALKVFLDAAGPRGVIGGQAAESLLSGRSTLADLRRMHAKKTGALFEAALLMPRDLAGVAADSDEGRAIAGFARELGAAFQVADDLEDQEETSPTSILFYHDAAEAAREATAALTGARDALSAAYGSRAAELAAIAGEVLAALGRAAGVAGKVPG